MNVKQAKYVSVSELVEDLPAMKEWLNLPWDSNAKEYKTLATTTRFLQVITSRNPPPVQNNKYHQEFLSLQARVANLAPTLDSTEEILICLSE